MPNLFSYCIPFDDGAAPNPFWGVCTLNICKPVTRRTAKIGDWIVGTGSTKFGFQNKVVYAMEISQVLTMQEYYNYCKNEFPEKIPFWSGSSYQEKVGDCIYDFSTNPPGVLKSVHNEGNRHTDLGGLNTLLSDNFYYFGDCPEALPDYLLPIVKQGQGHKSKSIKKYLPLFLNWIIEQGKAKNTVFGDPKSKIMYLEDHKCLDQCAGRNKSISECEERMDDEDES